MSIVNGVALFLVVISHFDTKYRLRIFCSFIAFEPTIAMRDSNSPPRHSFLRRGLLRSKAHTRSPSPKMVDKFLRRRVDSFRAAPPGPSQYDEREERYKAQDSIAVEYVICASIDVQKPEFPRDLKQILDAHDKDPATELKVSGSSWDTVFDQMADAKRHHEGKTDYSSKAEVGINLMSSYINIIPDEYGLGVLKGGLALIFSVQSPVLKGHWFRG